MMSTPTGPDLDWFTDARFGQFIHWGTYSLLDQGEQVLYRQHLKPSEYRELADTFSPNRFDADEWAACARNAGHRYALFTSKHHDGYCMFDTATHGYNSVDTRPGQDFVAEFVRAYRDAGLKIGIYFSTVDWNHPGYFAGTDTDSPEFHDFIKMTRQQIRELCSNYGKIDIFWFDGSWPYDADEWQAEEIYAEIRQLQPGIIINDRLCIPGDITTPEQQIPEVQIAPKQPWESCMTSTTKHWGYHAGVDWKSAGQTIRELATVADAGGNLVYNVGPMADGTFPSQYRELMAEVGQWLATNGEAIYGTSRTICDTTTFGLMTCKPGRVYLHVLRNAADTLHLAGLQNAVQRVYLLDGGQELPYRQDDEGNLYIAQLPSPLPDPRNTVIVAEVDGTPSSYHWARQRLWEGWLDDDNLALAKTALTGRRDWSRT
jgi:alpha-L-fucosidase